MPKNTRNQGFTLIEALISLLIIAFSWERARPRL